MFVTANYMYVRTNLIIYICTRKAVEKEEI